MIIKIDEITNEQLASICDHTSLQPPEAAKYQILGKNPIEERQKDLEKFLHETINSPLGYYGVCVRGVETEFARKIINDANSKLKLAVTVGFPNLNGDYPLETKLDETLQALEHGADEIDWVMNWTELKNGNLKYIKKEMHLMNRVVYAYSKISKVILETCKLTPGEVALASYLTEEDANIVFPKDHPNFVKTSTGFAEAGATIPALGIMRANFSRAIKAAGGVNMKNYKEMLAAMSGRKDGEIDLDSTKYRIGESSLFKDLKGNY